MDLTRPYTASATITTTVAPARNGPYARWLDHRARRTAISTRPSTANATNETNATATTANQLTQPAAAPAALANLASPKPKPVPGSTAASPNTSAKAQPAVTARSHASW